MAGYLRFEFYKQKKNKYYYLFFIIILASNITKAIPLINTDINWASFPLLAVPETVLLLVLFTIFLHRCNPKKTTTKASYYGKWGKKKTDKS